MMTTRTHLLYWILLLLLLGACAEVSAYAVEWASPRLLDEPIRRRSAILKEQSERIRSLLASQETARLVVDSVLGWRYRPGHASEADHINATGLRSLREYEIGPPAEVLRIAAFGDSFVYGDEVADAEVWCAVVESTSPNTEVLNYGVGGFGLDQAYVRFQLEGMRFDPDIVIIGFAPDDLRRIVNVYRRFISSHEWPLGKPRFILLPDGSLALVPNPLPNAVAYERLLQNPAGVRDLGEFDEWYSPVIYENPLYDHVAMLRVGHTVWQRVSRRYLDRNRLMRGGIFNDASTAFVLQVAVLKAFADEVVARGAEAIVLLMPDRHSLARTWQGAPAPYAPLAESLREAGVTIWDGAEAFNAAETSLDELFATGGHYSPEGNHELASWLMPQLEAMREQALAERRRRTPVP